MFSSGAARVAGGYQRWINEGDGPLVLLLHGLYPGAGSVEWHRLVPLLTPHRTVRTVDLAGFGASDRPSPLTRDILCDAVAEAIRGTPPSTVVVASSTTGAYALAAMRCDASLVRPLVLITPTGLGRAPSTDAANALSSLVEFFVTQTALGCLVDHSITSSAVTRWFLQRRLYREPQRVTYEVVGLHVDSSRHPNNRATLAALITGRLSITCDPQAVMALRPTVLWAEGQNVTDNAEAAAWIAAGATLVSIDVGWPQSESPARVAELVLAVPTCRVDSAGVVAGR